MLKNCLFLLGSACGSSFLCLGDLNRVFNTQKEWVVKISNSNGTGFVVSKTDNFEQEKDYSGAWQFLTVDTGKEKGQNMEAIIDLVVRQNTVKRVWDWSNNKQDEVTIFKCLAQENQGQIKIDNLRNNQRLYCQDLGKEWYYGWIGDQSERVSFVINKKMIKRENGGGDWKVFENELDYLDSMVNQEYMTIKSWIEENVLAHNAWTNVKATVNMTKGKCSVISKTSNDDEWCFFLGHKYKNDKSAKASEGAYEQVGVNRKMEIIDVSNYALAKDGRAPIWNVGFLPKITWE